MKGIGFLVGCSVACAAISAIATSSAAASPPEFGRCVKVAAEGSVRMHMHEMRFHGHYSNSMCTKASPEAKGRYEWLPGVEKNHFATASMPGAKIVLEGAFGARITCTSERSVGEYANPKLELGIVVTLTGCETGGSPVTSSDTKGGPSETAPGEVVIDAGECELGVVADGATPAGNRLGLSCGEEGEFAWLKWRSAYESTYELNLRGWWFYTWMKNSYMPMSDNLVLRSTEHRGAQTWFEFVEGPFEGLEGSETGGNNWYPTGLGLTTVQTSEEPVEENPVA